MGTLWALLSVVAMGNNFALLHICGWNPLRPMKTMTSQEHKKTMHQNQNTLWRHPRLPFIHDTGAGKRSAHTR